jgi:glutamate-1-semialdehyde 2,1-aminomutase
MCNTGCILPKEGFLERVQEICRRHDIVLIFDEIITGFRLGLGGAQGYFGIVPDLATFGKAMAAGFPISCLAGKRELMELIADGRVNHSGTFNSNVMAMAAAVATLSALESGAVHNCLYELGNQLMEGLREIAERVGVAVQIQGPGPMFHFAFADGRPIIDYRTYAGQCNEEKYHHFAENLLDEGVRVTGRGLWYLSTAHSQLDVELTLRAVENALKRS